MTPYDVICFLESYQPLVYPSDILSDSLFTRFNAYLGPPSCSGIGAEKTMYDEQIFLNQSTSITRNEDFAPLVSPEIRL